MYNKYFKSKLPPQEKQLYDLIYNSLVLLKKTILVRGRVLADRLLLISDYLIRDNPDIFFVDGFKYQINDHKMLVIPEYLYQHDNIASWRSECLIRAEKIAKKCKGLTDYNKLVCVHDIFVKNLKYKNDHSREVHTIVSPLLKKFGVCEGFAKTFKLILDLLGIHSILVNGFGKNPITNDETRHMWNLVWVDDNWSHFDITFDISLSVENQVRYDYFGLSDTEIELDHIFTCNELPSANISEQDFYSKHSLKFDDLKALECFINTCIDSGTTDYVFKLSKKFYKNNQVDDIIPFIKRYHSAKGHLGSLDIRYNQQQHVFHIVKQ